MEGNERSTYVRYVFQTFNLPCCMGLSWVANAFLPQMIEVRSCSTRWSICVPPPNEIELWSPVAECNMIFFLTFNKERICINLICRSTYIGPSRARLGPGSAHTARCLTHGSNIIVLWLWWRVGPGIAYPWLLPPSPSSAWSARCNLICNVIFSLLVAIQHQLSCHLVRNTAAAA